MKRSPIARKTPMSRTGLLGLQSHARLVPVRKSAMKSRQLAVTPAEKIIWSKLAEIGCIACMKDGFYNPHVSIHHVDGRTKPGCHRNVLPLCAGHHQDGAGEDKTMLAVHPWKARFERRYGSQESLVAECLMLAGES